MSIGSRIDIEANVDSQEVAQFRELLRGLNDDVQGFAEKASQLGDEIQEALGTGPVAEEVASGFKRMEQELQQAIRRTNLVRMGELDNFLRQYKDNIKRLQEEIARGEKELPGLSGDTKEGVAGELERMRQELSQVKSEYGELRDEQERLKSRSHAASSYARGAARELDSAEGADDKGGGAGGFLDNFFSGNMMGKALQMFLGFAGLKAITSKISTGMEHWLGTSMESSALFRRIYTGNDYDRAHWNLTANGSAYGYDSGTTIRTAGVYAGMVGGYGNEAAFNRGLVNVMGYARGQGLDPAAVAMFAGESSRFGLTGNLVQKELLGYLTEATTRGRMRGREDEVMSSFTSVVGQLADRLVRMPSQEGVWGLLSQLDATGIEALRGMRGAGVVNKLDSFMQSPGGGDAGEMALYRALAGGQDLPFFEFQYLREQGIFGVNKNNNKTNLQSIMEYAQSTFPTDPYAHLEYGSAWTGLSRQQYGALESALMKNGKFQSGTFGDLSGVVQKYGGNLEQMSGDSLVMLARLLGDPSSQGEVLSQYLAQGGKVSGNGRDALIEALVKNPIGNLMTPAEKVNKTFTELTREYEKLGEHLKTIIGYVQDAEKGILGAVNKGIDYFVETGGRPGLWSKTSLEYRGRIQAYGSKYGVNTQDIASAGEAVTAMGTDPWVRGNIAPFSVWGPSRRIQSVELFTQRLQENSAWVKEHVPGMSEGEAYEMAVMLTYAGPEAKSALTNAVVKAKSAGNVNRWHDYLGTESVYGRIGEAAAQWKYGTGEFSSAQPGMPYGQSSSTFNGTLKLIIETPGGKGGVFNIKMTPGAGTGVTTEGTN